MQILVMRIMKQMEMPRDMFPLILTFLATLLTNLHCFAVHIIRIRYTVS